MIDPQPPAPVFENGAHVKVRRLQGVFTVLSSRMVGKVLRYRLDAVPDTGCILTGTESFAEDMQPVPAPEPAPELSLAPDPPAPHSPPQELALASPDAAAPAAERSAAAAVCELAPGITLTREAGDDENFSLDPGSFGGDLDEYSPGAQDLDHSGDPEEPFRETSEREMRQIAVRKSLRYTPAVSIFYHNLKDILYSGKFKGLEGSDDRALDQLEENTPVGVVATRERNGSAVWIVCVESELRKARLEAFYPAERGEEGMAIEHAVMLALRQVPIRTNDLEILLLQLGK